MPDSNLSLELDNILQKILSSRFIPRAEKERLKGIVEGRYIAPLTGDVMSKRLFSPDTNPERFDYIMQRVMRDPTIKAHSSAVNEPPVEFEGSKKVISDLSSWLTDGRYADLEIQQFAEEFSFDRFDIYSSRMLILQYSAKEGQPKRDITYENYKGIIIVVLMRDSPDFLKNSGSNRYIHRITKAVSDSGIELESRRKIAFVQLDKALEQFLDDTYNKDEDYELLVELAMLKDPNNEKVRQAVMKRDHFKCIYADAVRFSLDKEVQLMTLKDEFKLFDIDNTIEEVKRKVAAESSAKGRAEGMAKGMAEGMAKGMAEGRAEGKAEGRAEGMAEGRTEGISRLNALNSWLFNNGRDEDVKKATNDGEFRAKLFEEYDKAQTAV